MYKIAVLGATGLIGSWVYKVFQNKGYQTVGTGFDNTTNDLVKLNIGDFHQLEKFINLEQPNVLVNCAGKVSRPISNTEKTETEIANLAGVKNIANLCIKNRIKLIHFSTIVVHDGKKTSPYLEEDEPTEKPGDEINRTKSEAELFAESVPDSVIIRLGDTYGYNQRNPDSIGGESFRLAYNTLKQGQEFFVYKVKANKTLISDLGTVVFELFKKNYKGRINVGGEAIENYDFVTKMKKNLNLSGKITPQTPPAGYPLHKLLDLSKMNDLGIKLHSVDEGLKILYSRMGIKL